MAKIGRQEGQARFHIDPFTVPSDDAVDRHGVAEVMQARLPAIRLRAPQPSMLPQTRKDFFELLARDRTTATRRKKSRVRAIGVGQRLPRLAVGLQRHAQVSTNGDDARLKELRIPNREEALAVVHITTP